MKREIAALRERLEALNDKLEAKRRQMYDAKRSDEAQRTPGSQSNCQDAVDEVQRFNIMERLPVQSKLYDLEGAYLERFGHQCK
jgi:hypothetical protein